MRIAACTVVAVVGFSLDSVAQPPAHANGKAYAYAYGHAKRSDFAANDFRIGLRGDPSTAVAATSSPEKKNDAPVARPDVPPVVVPSGKAAAKENPPDCIAR
jgi:hypothetical protein